jgi:hypothetical protein
MAPSPLLHVQTKSLWTMTLLSNLNAKWISLWYGQKALFVLHMHCSSRVFDKIWQVVNHILLYFVYWIRKIKNTKLRTSILKPSWMSLKLKCIKIMKTQCLKLFVNSMTNIASSLCIFLIKSYDHWKIN